MHVKRTPVLTPFDDAGLLRVIARTPSAKLVSVAVHLYADVSAPEMRAGSGFVTAPHTPLDTETWPPWPEEDKLNVIAALTLSQFISMLNSNVISIVVAFVSLA
jgi:hypothetical protein